MMKINDVKKELSHIEFTRNPISKKEFLGNVKSLEHCASKAQRFMMKGFARMTTRS